MSARLSLASLLAPALLAAPAEARPRAAPVGPGEVLHGVGTEPFWDFQLRRSRMVFRTPDDQRGEVVRVRRFVSRGGGLSFRGAMKDGRFTLIVTRGPCDDGMTERRYPFEVAVRFAGNTLQGCGWTARHPATGQP